MSICKWCGKTIPNNMASYHSRTCDKNPNAEHNKQVLRNNATITNQKIKDRGWLYKDKDAKYIKKERHLICSNKKCGKEYVIFCTDNQFEKGNYRKFCSRSCANSRVMTDETKEKISTGVRKYNYEHILDDINVSKEEINYLNKEKIQSVTNKKYICKVCGKEYKYVKGISTKIFCSKECQEYYRTHRKEFMSSESIQKLSQAGKKSAYTQRTVRRSKNEIMFCELCENEYGKENVLHNENVFNGWDADVILTKYKVAVLWNGKWHYKEIMPGTSLKQIQNRDRIKLKEIENAGYKSYIIKDCGKHNKTFVDEQFVLFKSFINDLNK